MSINQLEALQLLLSIVISIASIVGIVWGLRKYIQTNPPKLREITIITSIVLIALVVLSSVAYYITVPAAKALVQVPPLSSPTPRVVLTTTPTDTPTSTPTNTPALTPTDTPAATPTDVLVSSPTDTPTPTPTNIPPHTLLYSANWSSGINGWNGPSQWQAKYNMLITDGSANCCDGSDPIVIAPYQPATSNYDVKAEIQYIQTTGYWGLGVVARATTSPNTGYYGGIDGIDNMVADITNYGTGVRTGASSLTQTNYTLNKSWHTYELEVINNNITFLMDSNIILQTTDNTYSTAGKVGIIAYGCQIDVRSFTVTSL